MKPGNQFEFFRQVELTEEGKLIVDVSQMGDLISLLSMITIQVGDISGNQQYILDIVANMNDKLTTITEELNCGCTSIQECPPALPQCPPAVPQLIDNVYVHPSGAITHSVPKGTVYNWGGFNIVR